MKNHFASLFLVGTCALAAADALAVTLQIADGKLVGATGVQVGTGFFDVTFQRGSCNSLVIGCGGGSFVISGNAGLAAVALRDQVFLGVYNTNLGATAGCDPAKQYCHFMTAYSISSTNSTFFNYTSFVNSANPAEDFVLTSGSSRLPRDSTTSFMENGSTALVFAVWSPSQATVVPEPAAPALMLAGVALLAGRHWWQGKPRAV